MTEATGRLASCLQDAVASFFSFCSSLSSMKSSSSSRPVDLNEVVLERFGGMNIAKVGLNSNKAIERSFANVAIVIAVVDHTRMH